MSYPLVIDQSLIRKWMMERLNVSAIEEMLKKEGMDDEYISHYIKAFRKCCNEKRQFRGFVFTSIGAVLGFISCLLAVTNPIPELYYHFLYGITSVAMVFIIAGLYFLFE